MPEYVRHQGVAEVAPDGSLATVQSQEWCGGPAEHIAWSLAELGSGERPLLGAFEYYGVRYLFAHDNGVLHSVALEPERDIPDELFARPSALPRRVVSECRDDLAAAFGPDGAEALEEELAEEPLCLVPSATGPSSLFFFSQMTETPVADVDALTRVAVAADAIGHRALFAGYVGVDAGVVTVEGASVSRCALVPRPEAAWNEIARLAGGRDASALFARLVTDHAADP